MTSLRTLSSFYGRLAVTSLVPGGAALRTSLQAPTTSLRQLDINRAWPTRTPTALQHMAQEPVRDPARLHVIAPEITRATLRLRLRLRTEHTPLPPPTRTRPVTPARTERTRTAMRTVSHTVPTVNRTMCTVIRMRHPQRRSPRTVVYQQQQQQQLPRVPRVLLPPLLVVVVAVYVHWEQAVQVSMGNDNGTECTWATYPTMFVGPNSKTLCVRPATWCLPTS